MRDAYAIVCSATVCHIYRDIAYTQACAQKQGEAGAAPAAADELALMLLEPLPSSARDLHTNFRSGTAKHGTQHELEMIGPLSRHHPIDKSALLLARLMFAYASLPLFPA